MVYHKKRIRETLEKLETYNATPEQLLAALDDLYKTCREGYQQQRQTAKGTVVELTEIDMKTALNAIETKYAIVKDLLKQDEEDGEVRDYQFNLHVITEPPKKSMGDLEADILTI